MIKYLLKRKESTETIGFGQNNTGTRYFLDSKLAYYHLGLLKNWKEHKEKYKDYEVYFTTKFLPYSDSEMFP